MISRKEQIEAIFEACVGLHSAEQRELYLSRACGDDAPLRLEIEELLQAHQRAGGFLAATISDNGNGSQLVASSGRLLEKCSSIGRYKLLEKIGEGGMGEVYMAEQEEPVRRRVALKIIKLGLDTKEVVARFEAERQALALMDDPNIAKVLDGGATEEGRPYFVMELVQGVPITKFCEQHHLSTKERIPLFVAVCQAIQHAHQKGIIHRDIKPSNVLVTRHDGVPVPKVIDFGVAKALNQKLTEKTLFTNFATMIGTPAYMSPEQAEMSGLDTDTRSDIYSLGVLLYELLTGTPPFPEQRLRSVPYPEMQRIILEEEPDRPSTRLKKMATKPSGFQVPARPLSLATDLDWIVMKCLEKDRNRRYETANGLAADLKRHLDNEPIVARPPNAVYRFRKFVRRHRAACSALAVVSLTVLLGVAVSTWALVRERTARHQADRHLRSALRFVEEIFNGVAPEIRRVPSAVRAREKLGEASLDMLRDLRANASNDAVIRAALVKALLYLSETKANLGEGNAAGDFEAGLQRAREAVELLSATPIENFSAEQLHALVYAKSLISASLRFLGRYDEAVLVLNESEPLLNRLERFPEFSQWVRTKRMASLADAAHVITLAGRPREGLEKLLPVLNSEWAQGITTNSDEWDIEALANTYGQLTSARLLLQQYDEMTEAAERGMVFQQALVQRFPGNVRHVGCLAAFRAVRGHGLMYKGRADEALASLKQSRQAIDDLVSKDPANEFAKVWRASIATTQARAFAVWSGEPSASLSERQRRLAQAEIHLAEAETWHRALKPKDGPVYLDPARAELAAARAKLDGNTNAKTNP